MKKAVFEGIKVAEFAAFAAGPLVGKFMAEHGATVVHVESYARPDGFRLNYPPFKDNKPGLNRSGCFAICNNGKLGITINLKAPGAIDIAGKLVQWADVVIENFTPGTMEKLSLGYEDLRKVKPDIIMLSTCNQGQTGPHARHPGFGSHLTSLCGFTYLTGYKDRDPSILFGPYVDHIGVGYGVIAVTAALEHKRRTGEGQYIDSAQYECAIQFMIPALLNYTVNNQVIERDGNRHPYAAPHNAYPCAGEDCWCVVSVFTDEEWGRLCEVMGKVHLASDPRFSSLLARKKNEEEVDKEVSEWTSRQNAADVFKRLQGHGVRAGIVQTVADLFSDPQLAHRGISAPVDHPEVGRHHAEAPPFQLSKTPFKIDGAFPSIGQHNHQVFTEFLGFSEEEFKRLKESGIIDSPQYNS